jgi:hypothetical protein
MCVAFGCTIPRCYLNRAKRSIVSFAMGAGRADAQTHTLSAEIEIPIAWLYLARVAAYLADRVRVICLAAAVCLPTPVLIFIMGKFDSSRPRPALSIRHVFAYRLLRRLAQSTCARHAPNA